MTDAIRCSTEGSAGVVLRDFRKDMSPGASGVMPCAMLGVRVGAASARCEGCVALQWWTMAGCNSEWLTGRGDWKGAATVGSAELGRTPRCARVRPNVWRVV